MTSEGLCFQSIKIKIIPNSFCFKIQNRKQELNNLFSQDKPTIQSAAAKRATTIPDTYEPIFGIIIILKSDLMDSKNTLFFNGGYLAQYINSSFQAQTYHHTVQNILFILRYISQTDTKFKFPLKEKADQFPSK